ncbi:M20/M25/M40 family metallo-hydrolase, partial [Corynebacterium sp. 209RC1]|nr:M20/M25/M40 family metallo-hydrolase [Corynebacterium sp. 209RC1]
DVKIEFNYQKVTAAVDNTASLHQTAMQAAKDAGYHVDELKRPLTTGEDFSGYQRVAPTYFAMIGSNSDYPLHHPKFDPEEEMLRQVPDYFVKFSHLLLNE